MPERIVTGGSGVFIEDREGNRLLDGFAGLYCVNIGYGRLGGGGSHRRAGEGTGLLPFLCRPRDRSLDHAVEDDRRTRAPEGLNRVYYGLGGSDANETNVKLVWYYNNVLGRPEKKKIISRWRGYHGSGLMTGSLTGLALFHKQFDLPLPQVIHTEAPYYFRRPDAAMSEEEFSAHCAAELEALIAREGAETIAAFIGEPVLGTGGIVPPPAGYWEKIQAVPEEA